MRTLSGFWKKVVTALSICLITFQLYTTAFGLFSDMIQRGIHLAFVLALLFILKPAGKKANQTTVPWYDVICAILAAACCLYAVSLYEIVIYTPLQWVSPLDTFFAVTLVVLILEASRRSVGWTFPILGVVFLIYAYYGEIFPGIWRHQNFSFNKIFQTLYHGSTGIWGTMLGLSATMLAMFGIFGAILAGTGGAETFIKIGQKIAGRSTGGSGKIAVLASSFFGMVSGSAIGNVVATGVFTIPSMKRAGYKNEWAAAIEALSSTGGQILPPVMGAAAFIMAQLIGCSYLDICKAAIIPAILFYVSCFTAVHLVSSRDHIFGESTVPSIKFSEYIVIITPLVIFVGFLFNGYTVLMGAFWATLGAMVTYIVCFLCESKGNLKLVANSTGKICFNTTINGTKSIVEMCGILAGSQITISLISLTGFATKLSSVIVSVGENNLFLCLFFSMIVCIILGMGLPTTAAYVLGAAVLAPALVTLEMEQLTAHLFVMYYACLSAITPPVCVAVFMASGLADAKWAKVGGISCMVALPTFIIPFTFHYSPALMLNGSIFDISVAVITAIIGVVCIDICIVGHLKHMVCKWQRGVLLVAGLILLIPNYALSVAGIILAAAMILLILKQDSKGQSICKG